MEQKAKSHNIFGMCKIYTLEQNGLLKLEHNSRGKYNISCMGLFLFSYFILFYFAWYFDGKVKCLLL